MFNLDKFIADSVTFRPVSMFVPDIEANKETLTKEIKDKKVCVIGGAGSIGSSFIKAVLRFEPKSVVVVDLNENGLAELVRAGAGCAEHGGTVCTGGVPVLYAELRGSDLCADFPGGAGIRHCGELLGP